MSTVCTASLPTPKPGQRFSPYRLFQVACIPNGILQNPDLNPAAKLIWARLAQFAGAHGQAFPSMATLARECGVSERTAQRAVRLLMDQGFLEREMPSEKDQGRRQTPTYFFLWHPCLSDSLRTGDKMSPSPVTECRETGDKMTPKENQLRESKGNHDSTPSQKQVAKKRACGRLAPELSPEEREVIDLTVARAEASGGIKRSPQALRAGLEQRARSGTLCLKELGTLRKWDREQRRKEQQRQEVQTNLASFENLSWAQRRSSIPPPDKSQALINQRHVHTILSRLRRDVVS